MIPSNVDLEQWRRRALRIARLDGEHYADRWVPGRAFYRSADDSGQTLGEGDTAEEIERLVDWGLLEMQASAPLEAGVAPQFSHRRFRLSKKGFALWSQGIPPIAGVADDRLEER